PLLGNPRIPGNSRGAQDFTVRLSNQRRARTNLHRGGKTNEGLHDRQHSVHPRQGARRCRVQGDRDDGGQQGRDDRRRSEPARVLGGRAQQAIRFSIPPRRLEILQGQEHRSQGVPMNERRDAADAVKPAAAASEERLLSSAEEFAASASKTTVFFTNLLQGLLVACVVLWVLDVPRQVFNVSFYTEQLLTVCLGRTLAPAFVVEPQREYRAIDPAGVIAVVAILTYMAYRLFNRLDTPPLLWAGLALSLAYTFLASRRAFARWFDYANAIASLVLCGYIFVRYEPLTYELAMLPTEGIVGSAILVFLVLEGTRRTSGFGFVAIILAMAVYIYISPHLPGDFQTRWVSPERLVAYLGLDVNSIIGAILQVAVVVVIPFTIMAQVIARCGGANFFSDTAMSLMGNLRGGAAKISIAASALFGTITGSAVSNVLAVGIVTIPTMIRS